MISQWRLGALSETSPCFFSSSWPISSHGCGSSLSGTYLFLKVFQFVIDVMDERPFILFHLIGANSKLTVYIDWVSLISTPVERGICTCLLPIGVFGSCSGFLTDCPRFPCSLGLALASSVAQVFGDTAWDPSRLGTRYWEVGSSLHSIRCWFEFLVFPYVDGLRLLSLYTLLVWASCPSIRCDFDSCVWVLFDRPSSEGGTLWVKSRRWSSCIWVLWEWCPPLQ